MRTNLLKLLMAIMALMVTATAWADATTRQINELRRNPDYFFAEATAASLEGAISQADQLLATYINAYLKDNNLNGEALAAQIVGVEHIAVNKGNEVKAYAYTQRKNYIPSWTTPDYAAISQGQRPEPLKDIPTTAPVKQICEPEPVAEVFEPQPETKPAPAVPTETATETPASSQKLKPYQQTVLMELMSAGSPTRAYQKMQKLESESLIKRYGKYADCQDIANSFWLIGTKTDIIAVLGPGEDERRDYVSAQPSSLERYMGSSGEYIAIWFQF
ncbi:MAG: hypothetical protein LUC85_02825 [Bacteroidales bacterium]|nr:hypothetical protein [Bacteroidales bacterium]MCD8393750.1 hypothetical protein [Bacteroidales bacterium]